MILKLYIELDGLYPSIWRRVEVHHELSLAGLHKVIQACFGWSNSALYTFRDELEDYSLRHQDDMWQLDPSHTDVRDIRLSQVLGPGHQLLHYRYGLGLTGWEHLIRVEERIPSSPADQPTVRCTGGQRACPPEAAAGPLGYREILRQWEARQLDPMIASWLPPGFDPERFDPADVQLPSLAQLQAQASLDAGLDASIFGLDGLQSLSSSSPPSPAPQRAPAPQRRPYAWLKEQTSALLMLAQRGEHEAFVELLMVELLRSELDMVDRRRLIDALDALRPEPPQPDSVHTPAPPTYAQRHHAPPAPASIAPPPKPATSLSSPPEVAPEPTAPLKEDATTVEPPKPSPQAPNPTPINTPSVSDSPEPSPALAPAPAPILAPLEVEQIQPALDDVELAPDLHDDAAPSPAVAESEAELAVPIIDDALPEWEDAPPLEPLTDRLDHVPSQNQGATLAELPPIDDAPLGSALDGLDELPALESSALDGLDSLEPTPAFELDELDHHAATIEPLPSLETWSAQPDDHDQLSELPSHDVLADLDDHLPTFEHEALEPLSEASALVDMLATEDDDPSWELPVHEDPFASMQALPELEAWRAPSLLAATFERFEQALDLKPLPAQPTLSACLDRLPVDKLDRIWAALELKDPPSRRREREAMIASHLLRADALMDLVDEHIDAQHEALLRLLLETPGALHEDELLAQRERLGASLHAEWFMDEVRSELSALRALGLVFAGLDDQGRQCALIPQELRQLLGVVLG